MESIVHVVDDDQAVRESLEALLLVAGYDVQIYESAEHFLARAPRDGGFLLLDVNMPGMSGIELLGRLSAQGHARPVLVLTARRDQDLRDMALGLGACAFLSKPVSGDELLRALAAAGASASGQHQGKPL